MIHWTHVLAVVPHAEQRYPTLGDWLVQDGGVAKIVASDTGDARYTFLLQLHELVEMEWCRVHGVTQQQVDAWDFEHSDADEPGDLLGCPYGPGHRLATALEVLMGLGLDVDGAAYEAALAKLTEDDPSGVVGHP